MLDFPAEVSSMKAIQIILIILILLLGSVVVASAATMTTTPPPAQTKNSVNNKVSTKETGDTRLSKDDKTIIVIKDSGNGMPWWGQTIITLLGFLISATMIIWQMKHQQKTSLLLQRENSREALRLQIYQTLEKQISKVNEAAIKAGGYLLLLPANIKSNAFSLAHGVKPPPLRERALDYNSKNYELSEAIVELFYAFESYEIACPDFKIFKIALSSAQHDLREVNAKLFTELLEILPIDLNEDDAKKTGHKLIDKPLPDDERCQKLEALIGRYKEITTDVNSYMHDLQIDAQNKLLNKLFDNKLPPRRPLDPKYKVITTDPKDIEELKRYFENETAWGQYMKAVTGKERVADLD